MALYACKIHNTFTLIDNDSSGCSQTFKPESAAVSYLMKQNRFKMFNDMYIIAGKTRI